MKSFLSLIQAILVLLYLTGCGSNSPDYYQQKTDANKEKSTAGTDNKEVAVDACRDQFKRAFDATNPEMMGLQNDRDNPLLFFREWFRECAPKESTQPAVDSAYLEKYLGKPAVDYVLRKEYDGRDMTHIRDSQLFHKMAIFATENANTPLEKILALHEFTMNSIALNAQFESKVPRGAFEILKFGRGNKNDRTWIFANLLRQLRFDTFLIIGKPPADSQEKSITPLIGVLADDKVYLFDLYCSIPIPAVDDPREAFVTKPATLEELQSNPKLFDSMFAGLKVIHPLTQYDFSSPRIFIISSSSFYAPRMKEVQKGMTGISTAIVYDELAGSPAAQRDRIFKGLKEKIPQENIGIWPYPENMIIRFENPTEEDLVEYKKWNTPFELTSETVRTTQDFEDNNLQTMTKERQFLQARYKQLNMNMSDALSTYGKIRIATAKPFQQADTEEKNRENILRMMMGIDASYWIAVAQAQSHKYEAASVNAIIFTQKYPANDFTASAINLAAVCLAHENKIKEAFQILDKSISPDKDPDFNRTLFYYHWWGLKIQPEKFIKKETTEEKAPDKKAPDKKEEPAKPVDPTGEPKPDMKAQPVPEKVTPTEDNAKPADPAAKPAGEMKPEEKSGTEEKPKPETPQTGEKQPEKDSVEK